MAEQSETLEQKVERYELTLHAISACTLTGTDFGDWVQAVVDDALDGRMPECWDCGGFVHLGPCAGGEDENEKAIDED